MSSSGPNINFVELLSFYDLSGINGVKELPRIQESTSPPIYIPNFLIYGNDIVKSVHVSYICMHTVLYILFVYSPIVIYIVCP